MAGECLLRELLGPLHPNKDDKEEECVQEDEGDQDSEFVDAEELCSGGIRAGSLPGRIRGERAPTGPGLQSYCKMYFRFSLPGARAPIAADLWRGMAKFLRTLHGVVIVIMAVTMGGGGTCL